MLINILQAGMGGSMCAMSKVNETYSCEMSIHRRSLKISGTKIPKTNEYHILTDPRAPWPQIQGELGFPGLVQADSGAQHTAINSENAGLDYLSTDTGSLWTDSTMEAALNNGSITMDRLDDMAIRNLKGCYKLGQDTNYPAYATNTDYVVSKMDLKNVDNGLQH